MSTDTNEALDLFETRRGLALEASWAIDVLTDLLRDVPLDNEFAYKRAILLRELTGRIAELNNVIIEALDGCGSNPDDPAPKEMFNKVYYSRAGSVVALPEEQTEHV